MEGRKLYVRCRVGGVHTTLEDVLTLWRCLYMEILGSTYARVDKEKLQRLTEMASSKSSYSSWIHYFDDGEGSLRKLALEAVLAY